MSVSNLPGDTSAAANASGSHEWLMLPRRHPGDPMQWISAVVIGVPIVMLAVSLWRNPALELDVVAQYLFDPTILAGVVTTVSLVFVCFISGIVIGLVLFAMRIATNPMISTFASTVIWALRGVPPLVQILFWYNLGALYPAIKIGLPFIGLPLVDIPTSSVIGSYSAAFISLTLVQGAYQAEIFRAGLLSAGYGQTKAALAIGMTEFQAMRYVIFPQVLPVILPPTGNQFIHLVKSTSIVSFIALGDILYSAEYVFHENGKVIPLLIVAILWYLAIINLAAVVQNRLEMKRWR